MKVMLIVPDQPNWLSPARSYRFRDVLQSKQHEVTIGTAKKESCPVIDDSYDLVCNHALQAPPSTIGGYAAKYPHTQFVNINHCSNGYTGYSDRYVVRMAESLAWAKRQKNCWYATQEITPLYDATGIVRSVHLPMAMVTLTKRDNRPSNPKPRLLMGGRIHPIKNLINQFQATQLIGDSVQLELVMDITRAYDKLIKAMGLRPKRHGYLDHSKWLNCLRHRADLCLSCGFTESFCIVACEAMQLGIPTLTSGSVPFADPELLVEANSPVAIADMVRHALSDYDRFSERAAVLGQEAAHQHNRQYIRTLEMIGDKRMTGRARECLRRLVELDAPKFVEVGVLRGHTSEAILGRHRQCHGSLIDSWLPFVRSNGDEYSQTDQDNHEAQARERVARFGDRATIIKESSAVAATSFADASQDLVFIDARHAYPAVKQDIKSWLPKVKTAGWIGGHDYADPSWEGVTRAVNEKFGKRVVRGEDFTWWVKVTDEDRR